MNQWLWLHRRDQSETGILVNMTLVRVIEPTSPVGAPGSVLSFGDDSEIVVVRETPDTIAQELRYAALDAAARA